MPKENTTYFFNQSVIAITEEYSCYISLLFFNIIRFDLKKTVLPLWKPHCESNSEGMTCNGPQRRLFIDKWQFETAIEFGY